MINTSQVLMLSYFSMLFKHFLRYFAVNFYLFFQFAILSPRLTFSPENLETIFLSYIMYKLRDMFSAPYRKHVSLTLRVLSLFDTYGLKK